MIGYITLTFRAHKEGKQYEARCEELGISTCARSLDLAFERLKDATDLYLTCLEEEKERDRVFNECGVVIQWGEPTHQSRSVCVQPDEDVVSLYSAPLPSIAFA